MVVTSCVDQLVTIQCENWKCLDCYPTVIDIYTLMNICIYCYAWQCCMHETKMVMKVNTCLNNAYLWLTLLMGLSKNILMATWKHVKVKHCNVNCNSKREGIMLWYAWLCYLETNNVYHLYVSYISWQYRYCRPMIRVMYKYMVYINISSVLMIMCIWFIM